MPAHCITALPITDDPWLRLRGAASGWWSSYCLWHDRQSATAIMMALQARRTLG